MNSGGSGSRGKRLLNSAMEYLTHWGIAGAVITLTGFAPEHWIADVFGYLAIPASLRREWMHGFDIRIVLVAFGVAIIAWDVLHRSRLQRRAALSDSPQATIGHVQTPDQSSSDQKRTQANEATALALPDKPSIAVLPFQNLSGDPEQDYFADGMAEDLTTALSKIRWFFVISRNSAFTYKGKQVEIKQAARELGVRYVLEGSVRKSGSRVRITAQLIDAISGHHVWAERYDRDIADIFALQDEITEKVVAAIEPQLYAAEGIRAKRKPPGSLDAWECVVRALYLLNSRARADVAAARRLLEEAIELDPGYAQAHSLLAFLICISVYHGLLPITDVPTLASDAAHKALLLDVNEPWAHIALGYVLILSKRPADTIVECEKALALNPNFAMGHLLMASASNALGRSAAALEHLDIAERLGPRDLLSQGNVGLFNSLRAGAYFVAGRYREGIDIARKALVESPNLVPAHRYLVLNCALAGDIEGARAALQTLKSLVPDISTRWITETIPYVHDEDLRRIVEAFRLAGLE